MDGSTKNDGKILYDLKAEESPEPMSKIEAELEAELERLELNINASSLDRRLSGLVEVSLSLYL
jgi:predicted DNA-binding transcriptional regulator